MVNYNFAQSQKTTWRRVLGLMIAAPCMAKVEVP